MKVSRPSLILTAALTAKEAKHVLILGGGFGGMKTAERLEEELSDDPSVAITLVSHTNALLFTPMLAEVAGGSLEPHECILRPVTIPWRSAPEGFIGGNALANGLTRSSLKIV